MRPLTLFLFFASGACALIYEITWTRMLTLVFGNTTFAVSTILASFMAGLGLGSYLSGRFIDKSSSPLRVYGILEIIVAGFALVFPLIVTWLTSLNVYVHQDLLAGASHYQVSCVKFLIYFTVILFPSSLLGATFPIISKFFVDRFQELGKGVGSLYTINTLGAVTGCLATGFVLIKVFGLKDTTFLAAILNASIGVIAIVMSSRLARRRVEGGNESSTSDRDGGRADCKEALGERAAPARTPWVPANIVLGAFFISGFCALAYEVLWTRMLVFSAGVTTYAFSAMLATFLIGLAIGSYVFARFVDRRKNLLMMFGVVQIAIGISAYASQYAIRRPGFFTAINSGQAFGFASSWGDFFFGLFSCAVVLMIVPTILMGATFPLVNKIYVSSLKELGQGVGKAYALNSVGSALGAMAIGFVVIPAVGIEKGILLVSLINACVGGVIVCLVAPRSELAVSGEADRKAGRLRRLLSLPRAPFVICMLIVAGMIVHASIGDTPALKQAIESALSDVDVLHYDEGTSGTIAVIEDKRDRSRALLIDGFNAAGTSGSYNYMRMLGHLPMLLCDDPEKVLVIAYGTGTTSGAIGMYDYLRLDIVELAEEVIQTADFFSDRNRGILEDPRTNLIIDDGRNHMLTTAEQYDVISLEPLPPYFPGAISLYSQEFYTICEQKLSDQGVMCQWLPPHSQSLEDFKGLLKSFAQAFPNTSLWYFEGTIAIIGTKNELSISLPVLERRMAKNGVREDLRKTGLDDPMVFLSHFFMGADTVKNYVTDVAAVTDDHPYIEFFEIPKRSNLFYQCVTLLDVEHRRDSVYPILREIKPDRQDDVKDHLAHNFNIAGSRIREQAFMKAKQLGFEDELRKNLAPTGS